MKNLLIVIVCAATTSIVVTIITKSLGAEGSTVIGAAVGAAIGTVVLLKLCAKKKK